MNIIYNLASFIHWDFCLRAFVVSCYALFLFRVGDARLFSQLAPHDLIIFIIIGALLGNAICNEGTFFSSLISCLVITLFHKKLGSIPYRGQFSAKYFKGEKLILFNNQQWNNKNLRSCSLTKEDVYQELRCNLGLETTDNLNKIIMERNGKMSFLKKDD